MSLRSWFGNGCHLRLLGLVILVGVIGIEGGDRTFAQVTPDPSVGTQVQRIDDTTLNITGGTTVGNTNLFHSFSNFSVSSEETVNFRNAPNINNILVRVTGGNPSDIQGTLQAQANLFLINPNGIIFGENALLNINGSFIGTTASAIQFPGGGEFSMTSPVNPLNPLLRVNPSAFLFNQIESQPIKPIQVNEAILFVPESQSLVLLGGDVNLKGAILNAPDGRVELGGLAGVGTVGLNIDNNNFRLSFPDSVARADVSITNLSTVNASGEGGGGIQVQGRRVTFDDSEIAVNTVVSKSGGTLVVNGSESVELLGGSRLLTETTSSGTAGELRIETGRLIVQDGSQVSASTSLQSTGGGGTLSVKARDSIQLIGTSRLGASGLFTVTQGIGKAGELKIETGQLIVQDGAQISANTRNQGRGGRLSVTADSIQLIGTSLKSVSGLFVGTIASGDAGNLEIETGQLIVQNGARISASTSAESTGQGGSIIVKAGELNVLNNADITVSSQGTKKAGDLEITARSIKLDEKGKLIGQANSGDGGNIMLNLQDLLLLGRNSEVSTSAGTQGAGGNGGNITIDAPDGFIVAKPNENSDITANAYNGNGGTVKIDATKIFGIAPLTSEDLRRLRPDDPDPRQLPTNDITAISQTRPDLRGIVDINTLNVDPYRGLINLPVVPVDTQVSQVCQARTAQNQSSFTIAGRGGLPPNPRTEPLTPDALQLDWVTLNPKTENRSSTTVSTQASISNPVTIVEAQGWVRNAKGEVVLTADAPTALPHSSSLTPASCF
ncbi:filamentous hemagglutinin N-terminal domain-containing protein [Nostoc sp. FACHB-892]|uniref:two-partner secretion domain-containing protein n=1 Tax=Nostoc sp. FACHB-892 TaxID=2692843 RepID=UPI0016892ADD|nr:filamentous hemagglutinin N-terminal domain-containing protein [Nostoc sp. FACHB-892]